MANERESALSLDVKFKVKDVLRYNMSVAGKNIVNLIVLGIGALTLAFYFFKMFTTTERLDVFISRNMVLLVVPILIFVMIPWRVWKITLTQMQTPAFSGGVNYTFSNAGIILDIGSASEEISWDAFVSIVETKHDFRLYVNKISAQIIPKHNMNNEEMMMLKNIIEEVAADRCQLR